MFSMCQHALQLDEVCSTSCSCGATLCAEVNQTSATWQIQELSEVLLTASRYATHQTTEVWDTTVTNCDVL